MSRQVLRAVFLASVAIIALIVLREAGHILLLVFAGTLFALFLSGAARWLGPHVRLGYRLSLAIVVVAILAGAAASLVWIGPRLVQQGAELIDGIPAAARGVIGAERLSRWLHELGRGGRQGVVRDIETAISTFTGVLTTVLAGVAALVVFLFLGIYGAAQPAVYRRGLLRLVPLGARPRVDQVMTALVRALRRWLFGRVVAMLFVGVATTLALWLLDIPVALALGLLAGVLSFIEYIGPIASAVPALLLAIDQGLGTELWVAALFLAVHAVEGYMLTPYLARRTVHFPPGFTLAIQLLFGVFFGLAGLMLATPVSVVLVLAIRMLYVEDLLGDRA